MAAPTVAALQNQAHLRRARPPDVDLTIQNRLPLKMDEGKAGRRESKMGLRGLFNRTKSIDEGGAVPPVERRQQPVKSGGVRASLQDFGGWSHSLQTKRSEAALPVYSGSSKQPESGVLRPPPAPNGPRHMKSVGATPRVTTTSSKTAWDPPPLFQAYPQAIKTQTLSACPLSVEAIRRLQSSKENAGLKDTTNHSSVDVTYNIEVNDELAGDKLKRKHRKTTSTLTSRSDWTTKVYVLVTSGYLLQYAGDGNFDRLPEKMLHLGKDSAAFATDLIPGCHWVLQVSAVMDGDGTSAVDSRPLLSRLPFRAADRRHASNMLLVFDGAGDMDSWIAFLRREIEALGGMKHLSETGRPKAEDQVLQLRARASQRTLVVRDPDRFSRVITQSLSWEDRGNTENQRPGAEGTAQRTPDQSFDDMSTASGISHDGRQLENLRDSSHRLSYISSGQRTMVTSEGSSHSGSPVRDSFASQTDEPPVPDVSKETLARLTGLPMPDRRTSAQNLAPWLDSTSAAGSSDLRSAEHSSSVQETTNGVSQITPNFSVPNSSSRRYSTLKSPPADIVPISFAALQTVARGPPGGRAARRSPPTALPMTRPLSIVADQPSPPVADEGPQKRAPVETLPNSPAMFSQHLSQPPADTRPRHGRTPSQRLSLFPAADEVMAASAPRVGRPGNPNPPTERPRDSQASLSAKNPHISSAVNVVAAPGPPPMGRLPSPPRPKSSMELRSKARSRSPPAMRRTASRQRTPSERSTSAGPVPRLPSTKHIAPPEPSVAAQLQSAPARPRPSFEKDLPDVPRLPIMVQQPPQTPAKKDPVSRRRSMPHIIVQGPPPAPPPTCSLPPIPLPAHGAGIARSKTPNV